MEDNGNGRKTLADIVPAGVVKYLYSHPEGLDPPLAAKHCAHVNECKQYSTVVAKKGDVILLHGLLPHAPSPNFLHYARVITNPHVSLRSPYNLNRPDGDYVSVHSLSRWRKYTPADGTSSIRVSWSKLSYAVSAVIRFPSSNRRESARRGTLATPASSGRMPPPSSNE